MGSPHPKRLQADVFHNVLVTFGYTRDAHAYTEKIPAVRRFRDPWLYQIYTRIYWKYLQADVLETFGYSRDTHTYTENTYRQTF